MGKEDDQQRQRQQQQQQEGDGCCCMAYSCFCRMLSCGITLAILGIVGFVIWHFLGRPTAEEAINAVKNFDVDDFINVITNITDQDWRNGFDEDPYVGDNTTDVWRTSGSGLSLVLWNALDSNWQSEFEVAVSDWNESIVLTLSTKDVEVDHSCSMPNEGVMKVCNGNFGETGWVGINEAQLEFTSPGSPGFIVSSVAKMNEYYLNKADYSKRRYTMCHEIGHGFGLPHTDENHNNKDLGNCLDYTNTPENNLLPGKVNFDRLEEAYLKDEFKSSNNNDDEEEGQRHYNKRHLKGVTYPYRVIRRHYLPA